MDNAGLLEVAQTVRSTGVPFHQRDVPAVVEGRPNRVVDVSIVALQGRAVAMIFDDVTEERAALDQLKLQAERDPLTGLVNSRHLKERLDDLINSGGEVSLLLLDLDGFKPVNDNLGHQAGDDLLCEIARRLDEICDDGKGFAARVGGDEFAVVVPVGLEDTERLASELLDHILRPINVGDVTTAVGCSIGIASIGRHATRTTELLRAADVAMYVSKSSGVSVSVAGSGVLSGSMARLDLAHLIQDALAERQFRMHLQPLVNLADDEVIGAEGLVRWHLDGEVLPASVFTDLLRVAGRLPSLTGEMLRQARGLMSGHRIISWNVCDQDFRDDMLLECLGADVTDRLWLEVTETDLSATEIESLEAVRSRGVHLAIDEFGTGLSSMARLQQLPVDVLKLDRSLLINASTRAEVVIRTITNMAHELGAVVVAEGLETVDQVERAKAVGCDLGQGSYFGHPAPIAKVEDRFLASGDFPFHHWPDQG